MSKHTQTPWAIIRINGHGGMEVESDMKSIATVYLNYQRLGATFDECTDDPRNAESVANARLIAAAPVLFAACEAAYLWFGRLYDIGALSKEDRPHIETLRAAVANAKGE